jgi:hypothetical protein
MGLDLYVAIGDEELFAERMASILPNYSMNFLTNVFSSMPLRWWGCVNHSVLGIIALCLRAFENDGVRAKRAEQNEKKNCGRWFREFCRMDRSFTNSTPPGT